MKHNIFQSSSDDLAKKIFCAYHSSQFLTNFCQKNQCLMPLCPLCIHEHTQEHYQYGNKPHYVSLNQALTQAKQQCYENVTQLQKIQRQCQNIQQERQKVFANLRKELKEYKQQIYVKIQEQFNKYEAELLQKLKLYTEDNVQASRELNQKNQIISKQISQLYQKLGMLKGDQCLSALITYYNKNQQQVNDMKQKIGSFIQKKKEQGKLSINLDKNSIKIQLQGIFDRIVHITQSKIKYQSIGSPQRLTKSPHKITPKRSRIFQSGNKTQLSNSNRKTYNSSFYDQY